MRSLAFGLLFALAPSLAAGDGIPWTERPVEALQTARSNGRPVLVDLWAVWCTPCLLMDQTTYRDPGVLRLVDSFVPLKIDVDVQGAFADRYEVAGYPTVLFLDGEGRELSRLTGLVEAPELIRRLETIRAGYTAYLEAADRPDDPEALLATALYLMDADNPDGASARLRRARRLVGDADPALHDEIEMALARALSLDGRDGAAARRYRRLSEHGATPGLRDRARAALAGLERD